MKRILTAWGPAAAWAAFLFFMSSRPALPVNLAGNLDKVAHFGAYAILGFLLAFGASRSGHGMVAAVATAWGYGVLDELHQSMVPNRFASAGDWVADAAGAVAGVLLYLLFRSRHATPERVRGEATNVTTT